MRFFCDQDVDADVAARLRALGHDAWTANHAGLSGAGDDDLTVYSGDRDAVLLTHDREFSKRRRGWIIGRHIWLKCPEFDAADLVENVLEDLLPILTRKANVFITITPSHFEVDISDVPI